MRGEAFVYPKAAAALIRSHLEHARRDPRDVLTPREVEIVTLIADAQTSKEIAAVLGVDAWQTPLAA